jgi:hypothetical protein
MGLRVQLVVPIRTIDIPEPNCAVGSRELARRGIVLAGRRRKLIQGFKSGDVAGVGCREEFNFGGTGLQLLIQMFE